MKLVVTKTDRVESCSDDFSQKLLVLKLGSWSPRIQSWSRPDRKVSAVVKGLVTEYFFGIGSWSSRIQSWSKLDWKMSVVVKSLVIGGSGRGQEGEVD